MLAQLHSCCYLIASTASGGIAHTIMRPRGLSQHAIRKDKKYRCCCCSSRASISRYTRSINPIITSSHPTPSPALTCMSQQAKTAILTWREENPSACCLLRIKLHTLLLKSHQLLLISSPPCGSVKECLGVCVSRPKTNLAGQLRPGQYFAFLRAGLGNSFSPLHCILPANEMHHAVSHAWWETRKGKHGMS
jgi:hypothetical protein